MVMTHQTLPLVSVDNFGDEDSDLSSKPGESGSILRSLRPPHRIFTLIQHVVLLRLPFRLIARVD